MISLTSRNLFIRLPNLRYSLTGVEKHSENFYLLHVSKVNSSIATTITVAGNHPNFLELSHFFAFDTNAEFFLNPPFFSN